MNTILKAVMILSIITLGSYVQSHAQVTPTDFKVNETTTSTVSLAWTHDGKNVDKFLIERKPLDANTYTNVGEPKSTDRTFVDRNLSPNTQFQYRIYAVLNGKNGSPTALITGWTLSNAPTLTTPVVVSATQINVAWMSGVTSGQFEIQYANNANFTNATPLPSTSLRNYSLTGLSPNTNYYIRVRVSKQTSPASNNYSDWSVTQAKTQDPTPAIPSGLVITGKAETSIGVSWNAVKEANAYQLRYATDKTFVRGVETIEVNATSTKITNLTSGNTYYIQVRSTATVNNTPYVSGWSDAVSATTDVALPAAPSELQMQVSTDGTQVTLNWKDNSNNETGFDIEWGETGTYGKAASVGSGVTSYLVTGWEACKAFYVRVRAKNAGGTSGWIDTKTTTNIVAPTAPINLSTGTITANSIAISWRDNSTNESEFELQYGENSNFSNPTTQKLGIGTQSSTLNSLKANTTYYFRVRANNCGGSSSWIDSKATTIGPPAQPSIPNINVSVTGTEAKIDWQDFSSNETGFDIEWGESPAYGKSASVGANVTSYTISGLSPCKVVYVHVRSKNSAGNSNWSENKAETNPTTPSKPTGLLASATNTLGEIKLKWDDNSINEEAFELEYDVKVDFSAPQLIKLDAGTTTTVLTGLKQNTVYYVRIRAKNCRGVSDWEITNSKTPGPPTDPSKLVVTFVSSNQINMSWTDNADNETSYEIERSLDKTTFTKVNEISANVTSYSDQGLNASTQYYYRVRAKNTFGASGYSNIIEPKTLAAPVSVPKSPSDLSLTVVSSSQIDLKWVDNSDNEEIFEIERGLNGINFEKIAEVGAGVVVYSDKGLSASTKYGYRVRAKNTAGVSGYSSAKDAVTLPAPVSVPKSPSDLSLTVVSSSQIDLKWVDNSDNEVVFEIERGLDGINFEKIAEVGAGVVAYSDKGLSASTKYGYRVRAKNTAGVSGYSSAKDATTSAAPIVVPKSPNELSLTVVSSGQIDLKWLDNSDNEVVFEIERGLDGVIFSKIGEVGANVTSYSDKGLSASTKYYYRVRAKNTAGISDYSPMKDATTSATTQTTLIAPSNLTVKQAPMALTLSWLDNSQDETGFEVSRSVNNETTWEVIKADVAANTTEFSDKNVRPTFIYYYRVRAFRGGVFSNYSNTFSINGPVITATNVSQNPAQPIAYPNPASDFVYIQSSEEANIEGQLLTATGKVISNFLIEKQAPISLMGLEAGTYFIKVKESTDKVITIKLLKQ